MNISGSFYRRGLVVAVAFVAIAAGFFFTKQQSHDNTHGKPQVASAVKPTETQPEVSVPGLPVRLKIPKINVDAHIEGLGLNAEGDLAAPKDTDNVGWYNAGHRPGSVGNAVMDGHFGKTDGKPSVFDKLHDLQKGDLLYVEDGNSGVHTFIVTEVRLFQPDEDAGMVFRSNDNSAHLNIITCQGRWDKNKKSYSERLVVFTDLLANQQLL